MQDWHRRLISGAVIGLVLGGIIVGLEGLGLLANWEARTYDWRLATTRRFDPTTSQVVMGYVDQKGLDFMKGQGIGWPWPREMYANVLKFATAGGARAVVFDIIYSEDSIYGVLDDAAFATGLAESGRGYLAIFLSKKPASGPQDVAPILQKSTVQLTGHLPLEKDQSFLALPLPSLMAAARGFGNVQLAPDPDGIYRRVPLLFHYQDQVIPSLYIGMLHAESPETVLKAVQDTLHMGPHQIPLDPNGNLILHYYGGVDTFPHYSLAQMMTSGRAIAAGEVPELDPAVVKDKVLIVGVAAPGLYDLRPQPLASRYPGAEIHATAFQNILSGDFMRLAPFAWGAVATLLLAMLLGMALRSEWPVSVVVMLGVVALGLPIGGAWVSIIYGWWIPVVAPIFAIVGTFAVGMVVNFITEGKKKRVIRATFQRYMAPEVVKKLLEDPEAVALGGAEREITVYFSDIAKFTDFSEGSTPTDLVALLNDYLTRTTDIIIQEQGTIDKYIGDAVMAFWGAPLPMTDHTLRACRAALAVQREIAKWNAERETRGLKPLMSRIGIHTGMALVGNMGSRQRMNYTAMGDTVNLASRLEGLNKFFGTRILVSGTCQAILSNAFLCRRLGAVRVKGKTQAVDLYELVGEREGVGAESITLAEQFEKGLNHYRAGHLDESQKIFEEAVRAHNDTAAKRYVQWIQAARRSQLGPDWDGVLTFDSK